MSSFDIKYRNGVLNTKDPANILMMLGQGKRQTSLWHRSSITNAVGKKKCPASVIEGSAHCSGGIWTDV